MAIVVERTHSRSLAAWAAFSASLLFVALSTWLTGLNVGVLHGATAAWNGFGELASWSTLMLSAAVLGLVITIRRPENVIGPVFLAAGITGTLAMLGDHYAGYALVTRPGTVPGGVVARFISFLSFAALWFLAGVLLPALFPTGHPVSRRWRFVIWIGAAGAAGWSLLIFDPKAFTDDGLLGNVGLTNPLAFPGAEPVVAFADLAILALFAGMFGAIVSMVVRTKRSRGVERQQIKVVAYTIAITTVANLVVANTLNLVKPIGAEPVWNFFSFFINLAIPVSLGVALLRYRLYDIDRLINRTLVYAVLSALLAAGYLGSVVVFGALTKPLTEGSDFAVAGATLVIAAVFVPLRRGVQRFIDRRFYRTRYDATETLERFIARLRAETDLVTLRDDITGVAQETLRPAHVGLWLPAEKRSGRVLS